MTKKLSININLYAPILKKMCEIAVPKLFTFYKTFWYNLLHIKHTFLLHDYCYVYPRVAVLGLPVARQVRKYTHIFKDIATNIKTVVIYPYHAEDFGVYKEG